ncbi:MAG: DUF2848 domain-containing protein [Proteobacteria bacterium]|nr:DUF2848 domain-containing protein [Pseudomonadota bacterium]MBU1452687.1 DUF2848 domain-containing protein [Pseudomonadota bacterium]MBU2467210.1 DUF2848 domain-containing protein [Pseudomonadota bacterium]MBU2518974.1 DUF2848 domain-containing protein [Pseudomonadota bacterium]
MAVRQHIEELAKEGIEPPPMVPMYFSKPAWGLSLEREIQVQGPKTSGEIEFVLLVDQDEIYVGAGSDHTDRDLEKLDIAKSKLVCPSVIGKKFWSYREIKDHWDQIELRSWALGDGQKVLYQESTMATFLSPEALLEKVRAQGKLDLVDVPIFCGTSPLLTNGFVYADRFEAEIFDPVTERRITLGYNVNVIDWFKV